MFSLSGTRLHALEPDRNDKVVYRKFSMASELEIKEMI